MTRRDDQGRNDRNDKAPRWRSVLRRRPAEAPRPSASPPPQGQPTERQTTSPSEADILSGILRGLDRSPGTSGAPAMRRFRIKDPRRVTVWTRQPRDTGDLLARLAPLCVGDAFSVADPDAEPDSYCATISDTVAAFMIDATQNPLFGELPVALADAGWDAAGLTSYEISVAADGPGGQRMRYRLAKALLEPDGGVLTDAGGERIEVDSLADATWGSLW